MEAAVRQNACEYLAGPRKPFSGLKDRQLTGRCDHILFDHPAIVVLSTMCGPDDWPEIEESEGSFQTQTKMVVSLFSGNTPLGVRSPGRFRGGC